MFTFVLVLHVFTLMPGEADGTTTSMAVARGLSRDECRDLRQELGRDMGGSSAQLSNGAKVLITSSCNIEQPQ